jgi:hypothetical protein
LILNNTFTNLTSGPVTASGQIASSSKIFNNLAFVGQVSSFSSTYNSAQYDYTWYSRLTGLACHMVVAAHDNISNAGNFACDKNPTSDDPFMESSGNLPEQLALTVPLPGFDICTIVPCGGNNKFNQDAFGKVRGQDGVWDRGAFEFIKQSIKAPSNFAVKP